MTMPYNERIERIESALNSRLPFDETDPFQPRSIKANVLVRRSTFRARYQRIELAPVAFKANISMIDCMGVVSSQGGMEAYIWVNKGNTLFIKSQRKPVYYYAVSPHDLTDQQVSDIEIGAMGDADLLSALRQEAWSEMYKNLTGSKP